MAHTLTGTSASWYSPRMTRRTFTILAAATLAIQAGLLALLLLAGVGEPSERPAGPPGGGWVIDADHNMPACYTDEEGRTVIGPRWVAETRPRAICAFVPIIDLSEGREHGP